MDSIETSHHKSLGIFIALAMDESDHIYILTKYGTIILLNNNGDILSSIHAKHNHSTFSGISIGKQYLLISTNNGSIEIWDKPSSNYIRSISYPSKLRFSKEFPICSSTSSFNSINYNSDHIFSDIYLKIKIHKKNKQQIAITIRHSTTTVNIL